MKNPVIFYHLWPVGEWERINKEIFGEVVSSGLVNRIEKIVICVNSDLDFDKIDLFGISRDKAEFIRVPDNRTEWPTLQILYERYLGQVDVPILYMHCKGARYSANDSIYDQVNSWNDGMIYFNVTKWKNCINLLTQGKYAVGIRAERMPVAHYSGNFWWINSRNLRLLLNPKTQIQTFQNRHGAEFWIGRLGLSYLHDLDSKKLPFGYSAVVSKSQYVEKIENNKNLCIFKNDNYDLKWVESTNIDSEIYSKGNGIKFNSVVECYLTYIVNNYENLAKYTYFLKSGSFYQIPNMIHYLKNNYLKFNAFGKLVTTDSNSGAPNHPGLPIKELWEKHLDIECPESFTFTAGSVFGVSREEIQKYSKGFYVNILNSIEQKDNPIEDFCFERLWKDFFTLSVKEKLKKGSQSSGDLLTGFHDEVDVITNPEIDFVELVKNSEKKYILYVVGEMNHTELYDYISNKFDNKTSDYASKEFTSWKCFVLDSSYIKNNLTKKKKILQPLAQHIKEFFS